MSETTPLTPLKGPRLRIVPAVFMICLAILVGCSSGGGDDGSLTASFVPSSTPAAPDGVRLQGSASGDLVLVEVRIGGETTSADLYSFAFDLVLGNTTVAEYVAGSATFGTALTLTGSQTGEVLASQSGNRVTIGVTKLGGGAGNRVTATEAVVARFSFRLLETGSTTIRLEGSPPNPPAALDAGGATIDSVRFDTAAAMLTGS